MKRTKTRYYNLESLLKDFMDMCNQLAEEFKDSSDCKFSYTIYPSLNCKEYDLTIYLNFPKNIDKSVKIKLIVNTGTSIKSSVTIASASLEDPPIKESFDTSIEGFKNNIYRTVIRFAL